MSFLNFTVNFSKPGHYHSQLLKNVVIFTWTKLSLTESWSKDLISSFISYTLSPLKKLDFLITGELSARTFLLAHFPVLSCLQWKKQPWWESNQAHQPKFTKQNKDSRATWNEANKNQPHSVIHSFWTSAHRSEWFVDCWQGQLGVQGRICVTRLLDQQSLSLAFKITTLEEGACTNGNGYGFSTPGLKFRHVIRSPKRRPITRVPPWPCITPAASSSWGRQLIRLKKKVFFTNAKHTWISVITCYSTIVALMFMTEMLWKIRSMIILIKNYYEKAKLRQNYRRKNENIITLEWVRSCWHFIMNDMCQFPWLYFIRFIFSCSFFSLFG